MTKTQTDLTITAANTDPVALRRAAEYFHERANVADEVLAVANAFRFFGQPEWAERVAPGARGAVLTLGPGSSAEDLGQPPEAIAALFSEAVADHRDSLPLSRRTLR